jgi:hypothetical protein
LIDCAKKEEDMDKKREFSTLDIWLSAFIKLQGIDPQLRLNNGKVLFFFPGTDKTYRLVAEYNSNPEVSVLDFVSTMKILRNEMMNLKTSLNHEISP